MMSKLRYWLIPFIIVIAGGAIMAALIATREESPRRTPQSRPKLVTTEVVRPTSLTPEIMAYGRVVSAQPVSLISEVSGVLIEGDVAFQPARSFRKGDLLARVDDRQIRLGLNSKKAELLTALAQLLPELKVEYPDQYAIWMQFFDRCEFDKDLERLPEPGNQKIKLYLARFNVYKLYFEVKDLELQRDKYYFRAPFDGAVVSTSLRAGSTARQGSLLGEIINLEDLEVEISVPVEEVPWIDYDRPVKMSSRESTGQWEGFISRIGSDIEDRTQAVPVYVSFSGVDRTGLINGTFLSAAFSGKSISEAVSVPRSAVYSDRYVYLLNNGQLEQRDIEIAYSQPDNVIVSAGLKMGDSLVTDVLQGITPGMPAEARAPRQER